ncbi:hypothetical protein GPECTOR_75g749 [Gonium pectorale]|uniref:Uncharacterized protein n=1 Tax=Gonium pectorale TaxID=33097 RepID=A0A150G3F1_GONPE|nr:hypothetical protein GPECTOR_75g749 [Gonium pectorale]|eukprot:KXZ44025.1 hypothetical protein GPECTOR_75g749 [Gonium pectorale]
MELAGSPAVLRTSRSRLECASDVSAAGAAAAATWTYPATLVPPEGAVGWPPLPPRVWGRGPASQLDVAQHAAQQAIAAAHWAPLRLACAAPGAGTPQSTASGEGAGAGAGVNPFRGPDLGPPSSSDLDSDDAAGNRSVVEAGAAPQPPAAAPPAPLPPALRSLDVRCVAALLGSPLPPTLTALTLLQLRDAAALLALPAALPGLRSLDLWCQGAGRSDTAYWTSGAPQSVPRALPYMAAALTGLTELTLRELAAAVEPPAAVTALAALPLLASLSVELVYSEPWRQLVELAEQLGEGEEEEEEGADSGDEDDESEDGEEESGEESDRSGEGDSEPSGGGPSREREGGEAHASPASARVVHRVASPGGGAGLEAAPVRCAGPARSAADEEELSLAAEVAALGRQGPPLRAVVERGWSALDSFRPLDLFSAFACSDPADAALGGSAGGDGGGASGSADSGAGCSGGARGGAAGWGPGGRHGLTHLDVSFLGTGLLPGAWHGIAQLGGSLRSLVLRVGRCERQERLVSRLTARLGPGCWSPDAFAVDCLDRLPHLSRLLLDAPLSPRLAQRLVSRAAPHAAGDTAPPAPPAPGCQGGGATGVPLTLAAPQLQSLQLYGLPASTGQPAAPADSIAAALAGLALSSAPEPSAGPGPAAPPQDTLRAPKLPALAPSPWPWPGASTPRLLRSLTLDGDLGYLADGALGAGVLAAPGGAGCLLAELRLAHRPAGRPAARWLPLLWSLLPAGLQSLGLEGFAIAAWPGSEADGAGLQAGRLVRQGGVAAGAAGSGPGAGLGRGVEHIVAPPARGNPAGQVAVPCMPRLERLRLRHCAAQLGALAGSPLQELAVLGCWLLAAPSVPTTSLPTFRAPTPLAEPASVGPAAPDPRQLRQQSPSGTVPPLAAAAPVGARRATAPWDAAAQLRLLQLQPWFGRLLRLELQLAAAASPQTPPPASAVAAGPDVPPAEAFEFQEEGGSSARRATAAGTPGESGGSSSGRAGDDGDGGRLGCGVDDSGGGGGSGIGFGSGGGAAQLEHLSVTWEAAALRHRGPPNSEEDEDDGGVGSPWGGYPPSRAPPPAEDVPLAAQYAGAGAAVGLPPATARDLVMSLPWLRSLELCLGDSQQPSPMCAEDLLWLLRLRGLRRLRVVLCVGSGSGGGTATAGAAAGAAQAHGGATGVRAPPGEVQPGAASPGAAPRRPASAWLHAELCELLLRGLPHCQAVVVQLRAA